MSFVYGHTLWSTIQTTGDDSSPVLCIASPFRWILQCFPAQHSFWPSILIFPFSCNGENAAFRTVQRLCLPDKRTFSTTLKFYSSMDVHSIFLFHLTEDKSHWGSEQFNFVYAIHWHYSKGSTELLSDFFDLFLLWMWHLVVFNLLCSIWDYPSDTVFIDQTSLLLIFSYMTLFSPFVHPLSFNLSAH